MAATPGAVPHLIKFSGVINPKTNPQIAQTKENENLKSQSPAVVDVTFSLYQLQEGGSALWSESQQVQLDSQGRYSVLLGATLPEGLPLDLFTSGEALWLGVQAQAPGATEQPRVLLVAVPYALKAVDADTLGGKPASAYLSVDDSSATPQGAGLAVAASAAAGSGSGNKGEAEKKQRSANPSGSGTANYVPLWLDNNGTLGNSAFYQASNGNVGLGTTSPQQVLHVNGANEILSTGTGAGFKFQMRDGTTDSVWYGLGNVSRFFRTDLGDIIGITNNGKGAANVGIGTIAPTQVLHVNGPNEILSTGSGAGFKFQMRDGKTTSVWYGSGNVSRFWRSDVGDVIGITNKGYVGIGTTSPAATLEVNGASQFDQAVTFNQPVTFASGQTFLIPNGGVTDTMLANGYSGTGSCPSGQVVSSLTRNGGPTCVTAAGSGTVTIVASGAGLTGGPITTSGTLSVDSTAVPFLNASNTFTGNQTVSGSVTATSFSGNGSLLTYVNAALLGGLPASSFATLAAANTFAATQTVSSGDLSVSTGNLDLPSTTAATTGVINLGGTPFMHECCSNSTYGYTNTFVGLSAGNFSSTGYANTASGYSALYSNTTGSANTVSGLEALYSDTTGERNTASGFRALYQNTTGNRNTASGYQVLTSNSTGGSNTADGYQALAANSTGGSNTANGYQALATNTTGGNNTAVGYQAGTNLTLPTTGSNSTFVGVNATATVDGLSNATAIGYSAQVGESNALVLGNGAMVGIGTPTPQYLLDVQGTGNFTGLVTFASGQTFPGTGTVTSVGSGAGLTGGPITSTGTLSIATAGVTDAMLANSYSGTGSCSSGMVVSALARNGAPTCVTASTGTVTSVGSGAGLTGGPNTTSGTLSIPTGGVTNSMLANNSVTVTAGSGLSGGGTVPLGGTITLTNTAPGLGGTVTSVTAGTGLTASPNPITTSGTIQMTTSCSNGQVLEWNSSSSTWNCATISGGVSIYGDGSDGSQSYSNANWTTSTSLTLQFQNLTLTGNQTIPSGLVIRATGTVSIQGNITVAAGPSPLSDSIIYSQSDAPKGVATILPWLSVDSSFDVTANGGVAPTVQVAGHILNPGQDGGSATPGYVDPQLAEAAGGAGGGTLVIRAAGGITIASGGSISANGGAGSLDDSDAVSTGGGGGGVIILASKTSITNSGSISAQGGAGGAGDDSTLTAASGGGGGGIVHLLAPSGQITEGTVSVSGGALGSPAPVDNGVGGSGGGGASGGNGGSGGVTSGSYGDNTKGTAGATGLIILSQVADPATLFL